MNRNKQKTKYKIVKLKIINKILSNRQIKLKIKQMIKHKNKMSQLTR